MNTKSPAVNKWLQAIFLPLICLFGMTRLQAQDYWTGGGNGTSFSDPNNWGAVTVPASGDSLEFGSSGTATTLVNDLIGYGFTSIIYDGGGLGFTLTGNAFTNGTSTINTIITVNSANAQSINNNMILGNANQTISLNSGDLTLGGVVSGAGAASGLTLNGGGYTLALNGANTYGSGGNTTNSVGTIKIGNASALGASRLYVAQGATVDLNGHDLNAALINNVGAATGGVIDNLSAGGTVTLKVGSGQGGVSGGSSTYTAVDAFSGLIGNTTGTVGLTKVAASLANQSVGIMATYSLPTGGNDLRLCNTNTYTGPTTVLGGMLQLTFGEANSGGTVISANIISSSSALVLAGGDLIVDTRYSSGLAGAQTFAGLTLNAGASHLGAYRPSSGSANLTLNGITRNAGSTVDIQSRPSGGSSNNRIGAADGTTWTTNVNANFSGGQQTILGGYATFNGPTAAGGGTWAVSGNTANTSKAISGLAAGSYNAGFAAGKDVDAATGNSTPAAMTINSLRFNTAGAYTVNSSGDIVVASGGILETPLVGANAVAINNNNLTSGNGQDLIVHQYNTSGAMTIGANIVDNGGAIGLTKSGRGDMTLTPNSANTFSGQLTINAGSVTLGNASALNGTPALVFGGMSQTIGGSSGQGFMYGNGILNLNGYNASVASLASSADSCGTATITNTSATLATLTVNGSTSTSFTGAMLGGALSLVKNGSSTLTLGGTLAYSGNTTVSAGTLALTSPATNSVTITVNGTLDVSALSGSTLGLISPQNLGGRGTVAGNVTVASGAHTRPGPTGVTNTITGNLTYAAGANADFDLNTSATSGSNDQIVLSGAGSVLDCGGATVNVNLMGASLDAANDYVLIRLTGVSASISNSFSVTPNWLGTVPANAGSYVIVTDAANKVVKLHYVNSTPPAVVGGASPSTGLVRNQTTFVSVTNTPGAGAITNVYLDLTAIGGVSAWPMYPSSVANVYTNTIVIPAAALVGSTNIEAVAQDTTPLMGFGSVALTIVATAEVWNGNGSGSSWATNENWVSTLAPGYIGDSIAFDGAVNTAPDMDNSYSVTGLTFSNTASSFTIGSSTGSTLTLSGGAVNNSPLTQTLNVLISLTGTQTVDTAAGDISMQRSISGGSLTKVGAGTLYLGGSANSYTGLTAISNGTVSINDGRTIGTNTIVLAGGVLASGYSSGNRLTLGNNINVPAGNTGTINMSALNRLNGAVTGGGTLNINAPGGQDDLGGSWSGYTGQVNFFGGGTTRLIINGGSFNNFGQAVVTLTNESLQVSDNSFGNDIQVGALYVDYTATIYGPYQGNSPNFMIGGLNQNCEIAGNIQNGTRITKVGTGNLVISSVPGTASYTGQTIVSNGTLTVLGQIDSSPVTNYSGAMLAGTGYLNGAVDLEPGSLMTPVVGGYGTMNFGNALSFNGGTNVVYISTTNVSRLVVNGDLNFNSGGVKLMVGNTLTNGVYKLMSYYGALNGAVGNLTLSGFSQSGQVAVLSGSTPNEIDLIVAPSGGASLSWASVGVANNYWDIVTSVNWSNGPSLTFFTPGDHVTFNDSGAPNNPVDVRDIVAPANMVVTGSSSYTFYSTTASGKISGATNSLTVSGSVSIEMDLFNDYGGGTSIGSGNAVTVGNGSISASLGTGNITNNGALTFNQTNNLSLADVRGTGSLTKYGTGILTLAGAHDYAGTTTIGSGATLQVGTNNAAGPLLGAVTDDGTLIMNLSGALTQNSGISGAGEFRKNGSSTLTLGGVNSWQGNTYVNSGTLKLGASEVIPDSVANPGSVGWFILDGNNTTNAGTLDLNGFNETVNLLQGLGGTFLGDITNSAASGMNTLTFGNDFSAVTNDYYGLITENSAGAKIALVKQGASINSLRAANSFTGGTVIKGGTLMLYNAAAAGSGSITLSNGATLQLPNLGSSLTIGNAVITGPGATVTNLSGYRGDGYSGLFSSVDGSGTNVFSGSTSITASGSKQFGGHSGTIMVLSELRFASTQLGTNGGDNATFEIEETGTLNTRNGTPNGFVSLGALQGNGSLSGAADAAGGTTFVIGAKGIDSEFSGVVKDGSNGNLNLVKTGGARLTLSGAVTNTGTTTVSNGVLALVEPVALDYSPTINLRSATAVLDVSGRVDGALNLGNLAAQTLSAGAGTINGSLNEAANSTVRLGLGTLTVTNAATLNGALVMQVNRTNAITASKLVAGTLNNNSALTVTNVGPELQGGDTFQLFSGAVTGFAVTNLPVLGSGMVWTNKLAVNGSIAVIATIATYPTNLTSIVNGNSLEITWPATHLGWMIEVQTNNLNTGLSNNWVTVSNTATVLGYTNMFNAANGSVFYRLRKP